MSTAEMYTPEADAAVDAQLAFLRTKMHSGEVTRKMVPGTLDLIITSIAKDHPEIHDTEPRWYVIDKVNAICDELGWVHLTENDIDRAFL